MLEEKESRADPEWEAALKALRARVKALNDEAELALDLAHEAELELEELEIPRGRRF